MMKASFSYAVQATPRASPRPPRTSHPASAVRSATSAPKLASYVSRRPVIWAGGFAVIVIAGTILGAQLKSRQQAYERQEAYQTGRLALKNNATTQTEPIPAPQHQSMPNATEIAAQIAFLEERRGALVAQKMSLERKLAEVQRKQQVEREAQARREVELNPVR